MLMGILSQHSSTSNHQLLYFKCLTILFVNYTDSVDISFASSSAGKESTYNAGDMGSIPGLGRSAGKEIGYPLQYSWASPVAQLEKNLPAMWETWVRSLSWEDSLEKGLARLATPSSILAWRIPWTVESMGFQRVGYD